MTWRNSWTHFLYGKRLPDQEWRLDGPVTGHCRRVINTFSMHDRCLWLDPTVGIDHDSLLATRRESVWVFGRMSTSRPTNWLPHSGVCQPAAGHIVQLFNAKPTATAAAAVTCQKTTGRRFSLKDKRPSNNKNVLLLPPSPFEERQEKSWRYYPDLYFGKSRSAVAVRSCRVTNWLLSVRNVPSWTSRGKVCVRVSV